MSARTPQQWAIAYAELGWPVFPLMPASKIPAVKAWPDRASTNEADVRRMFTVGTDSGIGVFSRISASPSDSSHVNFFVDGGIVFSGMIPSRPNDRFGASFIHANISKHVRDFDRDLIAHSGNELPVRSYEMTIELSYQAQIKPGWILQPTFQYVTHPGGHISDPDRPERPIKNGAIFGVRTAIAY